MKRHWCLQKDEWMIMKNEFNYCPYCGIKLEPISVDSKSGEERRTENK